MTVEEMGTARDSHLGSWYYGKGQETLGDKVVFQQLEAPYLRMYELARQTVQAHSQGNTVRAETKLQALTIASQEVVDLLAQLHAIAVQDNQHD
ncbi:hypothetical protein [Lysinibacillus alkalisoli]